MAKIKRESMKKIDLTKRILPLTWGEDYYNDLKRSDIKAFIFDVDFDLLEIKPKHKSSLEKHYYKLIDRQGANLGNIESETFDTLVDIMDRIDNYLIDYGIYKADWR